MRYLLLSLILLVGCISSETKGKITYQAARLDRAVALISTESTTRPSQAELEEFIRAERKVWHALDYSINGNALPPDMQPVTSAK